MKRRLLGYAPPALAPGAFHSAVYPLQSPKVSGSAIIGIMPTQDPVEIDNLFSDRGEDPYPLEAWAGPLVKPNPLSFRRTFSPPTLVTHPLLKSLKVTGPKSFLTSNPFLYKVTTTVTTRSTSMVALRTRCSSLSRCAAVNPFQPTTIGEGKNL